MNLTLPIDRTAVLVIECQNDLVHEDNIGSAGIGAALATAVHERKVLEHIGDVLSAARAACVPVLYVNKENQPGLRTGSAPIFRIGKQHPILLPGSRGAEVHPAIAPQPNDHVIRRLSSVDASYGSNLFSRLRALGRHVLLVAGVSTNFAVEGTVRGAVNRLFDVVVAEDCCASVPEELHEFSIQRILPLLATVTRSIEICAALTRRTSE